MMKLKSENEITENGVDFIVKTYSDGKRDTVVKMQKSDAPAEEHTASEAESTKERIERKILSSDYEKADMLAKMDAFLLNDRITEAEYNALCALMG